jgi:hypothetical protein
LQRPPARSVDVPRARNTRCLSSPSWRRQAALILATTSGLILTNRLILRVARGWYFYRLHNSLCTAQAKPLDDTGLVCEIARRCRETVGSGPSAGVDAARIEIPTDRRQGLITQRPDQHQANGRDDCRSRDLWHRASSLFGFSRRTDVRDVATRRWPRLRLAHEADALIACR